MTDTISATGGCLCAGVRFKASGPVHFNLVCHCRMCQRASGSAFMGLMFVDTANVTVTKGATKTYGSSTSGIRHFCGDCGSSLFFERDSKALHGILAGALDDPDLFKPSMHICISAKQDWLALDGVIPEYEEKPEGMTPTGSYDAVAGKLVEADKRSEASLIKGDQE